MEVNAKTLKSVDWSRHSFGIGIELPPGEHAPWLELDQEELQILHMVLTRKVVMLNGEVAPAPAESSDSLRILAAWAKGVLEWQAARVA